MHRKAKIKSIIYRDNYKRCFECKKIKFITKFINTHTHKKQTNLCKDCEWAEYRLKHDKIK